MGRLTVIFMLAGVIAMAGCVENEESFFIEHAKVQPTPPDCGVSTGDDFAAAYYLNLFNAVHPVTAFFVQNTVMSQKDYGTLKDESNGIMVDGYELYTLIPGLGAVGGTEYFEYNQYIKPEGTAILFADLMSSATIQTLRSTYGCTYMTPEVIKNDIVYGGGTSVATPLLNGQNGRLAELPTEMYAVVRFLGHTQGGKEVQTQEFSIKLFTYCGVDNGWEPCLNNLCTALCSSSAVYVETCSLGLNQYMTCSDYLAQASSNVTGTITPNADGEDVHTINAAGNQIFDLCGSSICP